MNNYLIPNLDKACQLLKLIASNAQGLSASEIEDALSLPRTTAFRMLKTLSHNGLVEKQSLFYYPGSSLFEIGLQSLSRVKIRDLSVPVLKELAENTQQTAHLAVPSGYQSLIIEVCDSPHPVHVASRAGTLVPMHCSSTGKIFLAYLFENKLEEYISNVTFEQKTNNTITTQQQLEFEIKKIRKQGYAVDDQEFHPDVRCLAAAVKNSRNEVCAAIGVTGASVSFTREKINEIAGFVVSAAKELSSKLNGR